MTRTYRVVMIYRDYFEEEADSEEEAIRIVKEFCDETLPEELGNEPELFAFEVSP